MRTIDEIIKENINKFLVKESFNNEDAQLYHFTDLSSLSAILNDECLKDGGEWGGISLTRNRNSNDGYPSDSPMCEVRICFSPSSLMKLRGAKMEKFSYSNDKSMSAKAFKIKQSKRAHENPHLNMAYNPNSIDEFETVIKNIDSLPLVWRGNFLCTNIDILLRNSSKSRIKQLIENTPNFKKYVNIMRFYVGKRDFNFQQNPKRFDEVENIIYGMS